MSGRTPKDGSDRPHRGRPQRGDKTGRHRTAGPTRARLLAVRLLDRIHRLQSYADVLLHDSLARSSLAASDRALVTELVYGTLRWRGRLDYLLDHTLDRGIQKLDPLVAATLRVGAYQLVCCDGIPSSAAVDESVRCARALGAEWATGLVNATLRRLAGEHEKIALPQLEKEPQQHLMHALSLPSWIARRWLELYGPGEAAALARASNEPAPLTVRVNRKRAAAGDLLEELRGRFPDARRCRWAVDGIILGHGGEPGRDPCFLDGRFTVQDEAAQLVVALLDPQTEDQVLDACAAPGTKTTAIAERLGERGGVLAIDRHAGRLAMVARSARRLGLAGIRTLERDSTRDLSDLPAPAGSPGFDRALVDAPCSGLGTLRRNPDARWRVKAESVRELSSLQLGILEQVARVLRPGGSLVYSTCTLLPEENEAVVAAFLSEHRNYQLIAGSRLRPELTDLVDEDGFMRCLPHVHGSDGFFAARLERTK